MVAQRNERIAEPGDLWDAEHPLDVSRGRNRSADAVDVLRPESAFAQYLDARLGHPGGFAAAGVAGHETGRGGSRKGDAVLHRIAVAGHQAIPSRRKTGT